MVFKIQLKPPPPASMCFFLPFTDTFFNLKCRYEEAQVLAEGMSRGSCVKTVTRWSTEIGGSGLITSRVRVSLNCRVHRCSGKDRMVGICPHVDSQRPYLVPPSYLVVIPFHSASCSDDVLETPLICTALWDFP